MTDEHAAASDAPSPSPRRWLCHCRRRPVLLGTYDARGTLHIKIRDRYYIIEGSRRVRATCPRCGRLYTLEPGTRVA